MGEVEEILYAAAIRALDHQERHVAELRARTGTLLAAAALSASFLGATAVDRGGLTIPAVLAMIALAWATALCLLVLAPMRMGFALDVAVLHQALQSDVEDKGLTQVRIAYRLHAMQKENEPVVERLHARFSHASVLLAAELGMWMVALAVG